MSSTKTRASARTAWARPTVRRIEAGSAESAFNALNDGATQNS